MATFGAPIITHTSGIMLIFRATVIIFTFSIAIVELLIGRTVGMPIPWPSNGMHTSKRKKVSTYIGLYLAHQTSQSVLDLNPLADLFILLWAVHERTPSRPGKSVPTSQVAASQRDGWTGCSKCNSPCTTTFITTSDILSASIHA